MKILITNQQKNHRVSTPRLRRLAGWFAAQAGLRFHSLEILLTDDAGIVMANGAVFGRDYITDVISLA